MMIQIKEKTQDEQDYIRMVGKVQALRGRLGLLLGSGLILVGVITLPIPTGSIPLISLGLLLISGDKISIRKIVNKIYYSIVTKYKMMRWRR